MEDYSAARTLIDASWDELIEIFRWVDSKHEDPENPVTVLIGGWAVYSYNQWYGSIDIDIITNKKTRQHLMKFLRDERGYVRKRHPYTPNTVVKNTNDGEILIDFGSREDIYRFEGRNENCPFSLLEGQTQPGEMRVGFPIMVPTRALLLLFKLKAIWDRSHRLHNRTSPRPGYEEGKVRKDRADVLSLLDPAAGGTDVDLHYLGMKLREYPFLIEILEKIPLDSDAVGMYRRMSPEQARDVIDRLLSLVR
ncbi:MAG: hypothetical protein WCJ93_10880 [Methanomicrobiales archaeon]